MPIYTTYVGKKPKTLAQKLGSCFIYYVMRNRGNNEVAPAETLLDNVRTGKITWEDYEESYLWRLRNSSQSQEWMEKRAQEAKIGNILLVCYEKDVTHCHRRLLAEEIAKRFGVEYKGELTIYLALQDIHGVVKGRLKDWKEEEHRADKVLKQIKQTKPQ